ncbi:hypothetical protein [uncultured Desulfobacter sp.]|nr:hypothetical protein [uncultured Desulfobacter sp.]
MAMETSPMVKRMIRDQKEQVQRWDKMAHLFAQEKRPPENIKAEERIIRYWARIILRNRRSTAYGGFSILKNTTYGVLE